MEVSQIFGLWDQDIDSWLTNHKPLIPTLGDKKIFKNKCGMIYF